MTAILPAAPPAAQSGAPPDATAAAGTRAPYPWPGPRSATRPGSPTGPRFRRPPPLEPRYDDEGAAARRPGSGTALPFGEEPGHRPRATAEPGRRPPAAPPLPDTRTWASHFVRAAVEILVGRRPIDQLRRCATARAVAGVHAATARWGRAAESDRSGDVLHSVHVAEPVGGVAEVCAVIRQGDRYQALAARLEVHGACWQCVSFRLL